MKPREPDLWAISDLSEHLRYKNKHYWPRKIGFGKSQEDVANKIHDILDFIFHVRPDLARDIRERGRSLGDALDDLLGYILPYEYPLLTFTTIGQGSSPDIFYNVSGIKIGIKTTVGRTKYEGGLSVEFPFYMEYFNATRKKVMDSYDKFVANYPTWIAERGGM